MASASVSPAVTDLFGELKLAHLIIADELISGTLLYDLDKISARRSETQDKLLVSQVFLNPALALASFAVTNIKFSDYKRNLYAGYDLSADGDGHLNSGDTVFFLRMAYKGYQQVFLVLKSSPTIIGAYERIGLGRYSKSIGSIYLGGPGATEGFSQMRLNVGRCSECTSRTIRQREGNSI